MKHLNSKAIGSLSIDVEEYFQVEAYSSIVQKSDWPKYKSRIDFQMTLLLELLDLKEIKATFFVLGCIAKKHPNIIKNICARGHEIASHGFNHQHLTKLTSDIFYNDIFDTKKLLEDISGHKVFGYRAPCFSITPKNDWAFDKIKEAGYSYSSSTYPIVHDFYGVPLAPKTPYYLKNGLLEVPISTLMYRSKTLPVGGGGYFRLMPFWLYKFLLRESAEQLGYFNFYTHPWEYDPMQPKINGSFKSNFRHRINQRYALNKLSKLCDSFEFKTLYDLHKDNKYPQLGEWSDISKGVFK